MRVAGKVAIALYFLLLVVLALLLLQACRHQWDRLHDFDRAMDDGFRSLKRGMVKAEVFRRMRKEPIATDDQFSLGQYLGNEREYAKTNGQDAVVFYTWFNGLKWFYCVGFDKREKMVLKGQGGT
jgi:hypothetical protein